MKLSSNSLQGDGDLSFGLHDDFHHPYTGLDFDYIGVSLSAFFVELTSPGEFEMDHDIRPIDGSYHSERGSHYVGSCLDSLVNSDNGCDLIEVQVEIEAASFADLSDP